MFKLNFEKTVIFVLILILSISTVNIYSQYFSILFNRRDRNELHTSVSKDISFPAMLLKADQYYKQNMYKEAQDEYFKLTSKPNLSLQQKAAVHFKLGVCNYKLEQYDMARDSFLRSAEYNTDDPVAYNNAAVASFYLNELEKAEELQKKAVAILPVIEYQYNLARIYEARNRYADSAKYYTAVIRGEENITREDRIDPVQIKNKVLRLSKDISNIEEISKELAIALRLKDTREVLVIEDADMDIKDKNFKWRVALENGVSKLYCTYDRENLDPYNLIDSLLWTVKSNGKTVYTSSKDEFSLTLAEGQNYIVYFDIKYDNKLARSYTDVIRSSGTHSNTGKPSISNPSKEKSKYYEYAVYEQVFEKDFKISTKGFVDRFGVEWGTDSIETSIMSKDFIDAESALYINNSSKKKAGVWADLSSLLNDKSIKGRTVSINFYARKVTDEAELETRIKVRAEGRYRSYPESYELGLKWKRFTTTVEIPSDAEALTISFKTKSGEEIKLDGFTINIIN